MGDGGVFYEKGALENFGKNRWKTSVLESLGFLWSLYFKEILYLYWSVERLFNVFEWDLHVVIHFFCICNRREEKAILNFLHRYFN